MNEDTERYTQDEGRNVVMTVFGDTMAEIEMAALDAARAFYGEGWRFHLMPQYKAWPNHKPAESAKKYTATVTVRLVEEDG